MCRRRLGSEQFTPAAVHRCKECTCVVQLCCNVQPSVFPLIYEWPSETTAHCIIALAWIIVASFKNCTRNLFVVLLWKYCAWVANIWKASYNHPSFGPGFRKSVEVDIGWDQKSGIRDKVLLEKLGTFSVVRKSAHKTHNSNHMLQVLKSVCLVKQLFFSVLQSWSVFKRLSNDQH